eukprot:2511536-Prymnesium_polylepis.1
MPALEFASSRAAPPGGTTAAPPVATFEAPSIGACISPQPRAVAARRRGRRAGHGGRTQTVVDDVGEIFIGTAGEPDKTSLRMPWVPP